MKKLRNHSVGWLFIVFSLALNTFAFGWGGIREVGASSEASKPKSEYMAVDNKIYDDGNTAWTYNGNWSESAIRRAYGRKLHVSNTIGDSAAISITGTQFTLIFSRAAEYGQLDIYLDGVKIGTLNQKRSTTSYQKEWTSPGLGAGAHIIKFVHVSGKVINIDALRVRLPVFTPTGGPASTSTSTATPPQPLTPTLSLSATGLPTFTAVPSSTYTVTLVSPTLAFTPAATSSPAPTIIASNTPSRIPSPIPSLTPTIVSTATLKPTATNTRIPTLTATATNTPTSTAMPTASASSTPSTGSKVYYVSVSGSDSNPGSQAQPWRSIQKAAKTLSAGDTVYIRAGVYQESVHMTRSGTQSQPIRFLAYPGETPAIDGNNYQLPTITWDAMLELSGNYIQVSGIEVRYSNWMGVVLSGQHDLASNMNVHHSRETGMLVSGDYGIVENSRVWQNANRNETNSPYGQGGWATGLSAARHPNNAILRGNTIYNNWGEGLSTFEANGTLMEDNIVYDNWSTNVYISDATNVMLQRNLIYGTSNSVITSGSRIGIEMGDEVYNPPSSNNTVINNIVYGTRRNFYWWQGNQGGGLVNVLIANNTFVNSSYGVGIEIDKGAHQNARFYNNIVEQDDSLPVAEVGSASGITFSHNLWSKKPTTTATGSGDVIGDPKLAKTGGFTSAGWYQLQDTSPARNAAVPINEVVQDFLGNPRGASPDIGALEANP